jgi:uncharacterized protein YtpQ (UPF0354 family)
MINYDASYIKYINNINIIDMQKNSGYKVIKDITIKLFCWIFICIIAIAFLFDIKVIKTNDIPFFNEVKKIHDQIIGYINN